VFRFHAIPLNSLNQRSCRFQQGLEQSRTRTDHASRRTPDLPLITVMCNVTGQTTQVTDLGRAMIIGKCADIGKFKGPILRGLAGRAPYFHNGFAATLLDAVNFYDTRINLQLSQKDKDDLVAFLKTL
jgi:cytochrome c peroxidase